MTDNRTPKTWVIPNWDNGGEVIDSRTVCARIRELEEEHTAQDSEGDWFAIPTDQWPADAQAEYAALTGMVSEIRDNIDGGMDISENGDCVMLVHPGYLTAYVREWYADTYGGDLHTVGRYGSVNREPLKWSELMDREPFCWINWDDVADAWQQRCPEITYHGVDYVMDH